MSSTIVKNSAPIGFFDSGVGGVTVYSKFRNKFPFENCMYYGDTINNPYGEKSPSKEIVEVLKNVNLGNILKKSFYDLKA